MSYLPMGDVASTEWNSTKYPGVCKPSTAQALVTFKRMQHQLDRIAVVKGIATIAADGEVGPVTLGLFGALKTDLAAYAIRNQRTIAGTRLALATSCTEVAAIADSIADEASLYADSLKAPAKPPKPAPTKPTTLVLANGKEVPVPMSARILETWTNLGTTNQMVALAALGGVGWYVATHRKKRRR